MSEALHTQVCIAGGGPAGMMLGLLLARQGVDVMVLERHADFFRDFRGDTVHPSTLNLIDALGLRSGFERIPHTALQRLDMVIGGIRIHAIDFATLPAPNRQVALMPQWDLLTLLAGAAARNPGFNLLLDTEVTGVIRRAGRVTGVTARRSGGQALTVRADLVVAADGRNGVVRRALGLEPVRHGVATDVAWFRVRRPDVPMPDTLLWAGPDGLVATLPRPGYLQCALLFPKGTFAELREAGVEAFRARIARVVPRLTQAVESIGSVDDIKHLVVQIDRLRRWWRPGAVCIGDAAHAMSPVFGVGINYAVQDAVAAAGLLGPALRGGPGAVDRACASLQRRRALPTALMQLMQRAVHAVIATGRAGRLVSNPPTRVQRAVLRLGLPVARPLVAQLIGYGFRPERL